MSSQAIPSEDERNALLEALGNEFDSIAQDRPEVPLLQLDVLGGLLHDSIRPADEVDALVVAGLAPDILQRLRGILDAAVVWTERVNELVERQRKNSKAASDELIRNLRAQLAKEEQARADLSKEHQSLVEEKKKMQGTLKKQEESIERLKDELGQVEEDMPDLQDDLDTRRKMEEALGEVGAGTAADERKLSSGNELIIQPMKQLQAAFTLIQSLQQSPLKRKRKD